MGRDNFEYYISGYFWRYNVDTGEVAVYTNTDRGFYWADSFRFQDLKKKRFDNRTRWVSKDVFLKEAHEDPMKVKDAKTVRALGKYES